MGRSGTRQKPGARRRPQGDGTIYFDSGRQRWVGQVWLDGRRRKVTAKSRIEAAARLGRLQHGDAAERHLDRRITVERLLIDWRTSALPGRRLAPSTIEVHEWTAKLITAELGSVRITELDVHAVEAALGRLAKGSKGQPLGRASLIKVRSTLRQAFAWAERRRAVSHNPAAVAELPATEERHSRVALSEAELEALLCVLDGHPLYAMFLSMARVGLRPGEAAGLCADAIDLDAGVATVTRAVQLRRGRPVLVDALKTAGARRAVALPPGVIAALQAHLAASNIEDGLLFVAPDGGPLWPSTVRAELAAACETAGVTVVRPNELRHTAATLLADTGLSPHQVADILGHRSTRMVDAVYRYRPTVIHGADLTDW